MGKLHSWSALVRANLDHHATPHPTALALTRTGAVPTNREICPEITDDESEKFEAAMHELCMEVATAIQVALNIVHLDRTKEKERQEKSRAAN